MSTKSELYNALSSAGSGDVVYIDPNAEIRMGNSEYIIPAGVTLASNRGCNGADGGVISTNADPWGMLRAMDDVRVTGLVLKGQHERWTALDKSENPVGLWAKGDNVEVDNIEGHGWGYAPVRARVSSGLHVHHSYLHHNPMDGYGYGVATESADDVLIEYNHFNYNRHSVQGIGGGSYEARYNFVGPDAISHVFDQHSPGGVTTKIHHNTITPIQQADDNKLTPAVNIRGTPKDVADIHHNWIYNTKSPCFSEGSWPDCAIVQRWDNDDSKDYNNWENVQFSNNHYGKSEPSCDIGAPRDGCRSENEQVSNSACSVGNIENIGFEDNNFKNILDLSIYSNSRSGISTEQSVCGERSFKTTIPKNTHRGTTMYYMFADQWGQEPEELYARYYIYLPASFELGSGGGDALKTPGPAGRYSGSKGVGGNSVDGTDAWTARMQMKSDGTEIQPHWYVYHMDMSGTYGDNWGWNNNIRRGEWNRIDQYVKMNTPGQSNGVLRGWVNGEPAYEKTNVRFRADGYENIKIRQYYFHLYYGGSSPAPADNTIYIDGLSLSTEKFTDLP